MSSTSRPSWWRPALIEAARTGKWELWHAYVRLEGERWNFGDPPNTVAAEALEACAELMDDATYWRTVGRLLHLRPCAPLYAILDHSQRPGREHMLRPVDRLVLEGLPDSFDIWRGHCEGRPSSRFWTLSRLEAELYGVMRSAAFARGTGTPVLWRATAGRADLDAVFTQLDSSPWSELVVKPAAVTATRVDWSPSPALTTFFDMLVYANAVWSPEWARAFEALRRDDPAMLGLLTRRPSPPLEAEGDEALAALVLSRIHADLDSGALGSCTASRIGARLEGFGQPRAVSTSASLRR